MQRLFAEASRLEERNLPFAIVTIVSVEGHVPRKEGRMLVDGEGRTYSTIGGHLVESQAVELALECLRTGRGRLASVNAGRGKITIMIDVVNRIKKAVVIGYGHVGKAVARLLYETGYAVTVCDTRPFDCPFAAQSFYEPDWKAALSSLSLDENCALIVTVHDKDEVLRSVDYSRTVYTGVLSSRSRVIPEKGIMAPAGLDIGAETPEEIAVAVTAEVMRALNRKTGRPSSEIARRLVIVRGAGDLATASIIRLTRAGYKVLALETAKPTQVRRNVSFAEAVYDGRCEVDGIRAVLIDKATDCFHAFDEGLVPVLVDEKAESVRILHPAVLIDAIIAKRNLGTSRDMAPLTIALGPGFIAGSDVDVVIETKRGHTLGRIITEGSAIENTGVPGNIGGYSSERVIRSSCAGVFRGLRTFGDIVKKGDAVAMVGNQPQYTVIDGMVRGMLHDGLEVPEGFKIADIDPRGEGIEYNTPSDKAYAIAGGVLEAVDRFFHEFI